MSNLSLIWAMDSNRLIGNANALPWYLPADLAFFKRTTLGKPILMGRKTYQSIGKPLPGRRNIVITRDPGFCAAGCDIATGIDEALRLCADAEEVMLIGGASLYEQTIDRASKLYITRIHGEFEGDTWFPEFNIDAWNIESREDFDADQANPYSYSLVKYVREI
jgi:dihydrofolate reductase